MPDRYQDEIEEILRQSGESAPVKSLSERQRPPEDSPQTYDSLRDLKQADSRPARWWPSVSPGKVMLGGLVIFLIGALWVGLLIWIGLAVLVAAYLLFFVRPGSASLEKRWRGRSVENDGEEHGTAVGKLKKWLRS